MTTSPWPIIPLTFGGTDLCPDDHTMYFWIESGLWEVPATRGVDTIVPGTAGRTERNRVKDILPVVLRGQVTSDPGDTTRDSQAQSWWDNVAVVRALFDPAAARRDLVASLPGGGTATISARTMNVLTVDRIDGAYLSLSIELEGSGDWVFA